MATPSLVVRVRPDSVALETTLLLHGVPRAEAAPLALAIDHEVRSAGGSPALVGVLAGTPVVGLKPAELEALLASPQVAKANTANLGVLIHRKQHAATTVSTTVELAAAAGVRIFATGGLGGVHREYGTRWDISADLGALARFPVGVVCSGTKSLLDVEATREALETLGVPVVGFRTDFFPAFYRRQSSARVDARFDSLDELAGYVAQELARTGRGVVICNPIPPEHELDSASWDRWLSEAQATVAAAGVQGREVTPALLAQVHIRSGGATLAANIALVKSNASLAGAIMSRMARLGRPLPPDPMG